jgi:hypothetical protein
LRIGTWVGVEIEDRDGRIEDKDSNKGSIIDIGIRINIADRGKN